MDIIVGTAGHIDHGKTALVKALTGVDADRLPEEKKRGITIDLGFAELDLGAVRIGFVDVPGHEKFVKNMLAGASGIDLVLLVIAADEGVMPQTREHFEICRLLEIKTGLIVLTKTDLVDEELLEIAKLDAAELVHNSFLENASVIAVSAKTGAGILELKETLRKVSPLIPPRKNESVARLPIDRTFSVKGFGSVVTGTLVSGEINESIEMEILPLKRKVRVRGLQTHGKIVKTANAGQRAAVNLGGIEHTEIVRGMVLAAADVLRPTQIFDAEIEVLADAKKSLKSRQRIRVHIGTIEALARLQILNDKNEIAPGEKDFAQIRLENSVVTVPTERFILRLYSPQMTVAGGKILDAFAAKHRRKDIENVRKYLENLINVDAKDDKPGQIKIFLETCEQQNLTFKDLQARTGWRSEVLKRVIDESVLKKAIVEVENFYIARMPFENLKTKILAEIENLHRREPLARGIQRETLREKTAARLSPQIFKTTLAYLEKEGKITVEKDFVKSRFYLHELTSEEEEIRSRLRQIYASAKLEVPTLETALAEASRGGKFDKERARKIFRLLINSGEVLKISEEFYFSKKAIDELIENVKNFAAKTSDRLMDVTQFKEIAGVSRKYAIPILEYFDREKLSRRAGDKRLIS
ncbi:MAG: selenocysteine-specific translation elongation factor [Acidobacteria bacterium]|nr:selenocysteine-specific translation elongation factor [Acidobacteriota bacterium]